jgi:hypothetical protein
MFRSKKTKTEFVTLNDSFKDWRDASDEVEAMGNKLDSVRETVKACKPGTWAHDHWTQVEEVILRKWKLMVSLQQGGLRQIGPDRAIPIDYDWWEGSDEAVGFLPVPAFLSLNFINDWFNHGDLEHSWAKAQEQKLQKARQGLA